MKGIKAAKNRIPIGAYCFVSRWKDGSPCDPWGVGILDSVIFQRGPSDKDIIVYYTVITKDGESRSFKNCIEITVEEGRKILEKYPSFEASGLENNIRKFLARKVKKKMPKVNVAVDRNNKPSA